MARSRSNSGSGPIDEAGNMMVYLASDSRHTKEIPRTDVRLVTV